MQLIWQIHIMVAFRRVLQMEAEIRLDPNPSRVLLSIQHIFHRSIASSRSITIQEASKTLQVVIAVAQKDFKTLEGLKTKMTLCVY